MSLPLFQAVLRSPRTKSATRFALALMAFHACSRCGRVYISATTLAREMNHDVRNTQTLLRKLVEAHWLVPTGEHGPKGVNVYTLAATMVSSGDDAIRDETIAVATMVSSPPCRFCTMKSSPNRQVVDRHEIDQRQDGSLTREGEETNGQEAPKPCSVPDCPLPTGHYSRYQCDPHALIESRRAVKAGPTDEHYQRGCEILRMAAEEA